MNRINGTFVVALAALSAVSCNQSKQPNVVIIFSDDQGYQDLGCYGSPLISTPAIDKMAAEGIRFTDFHVSTSVSSASRASLLTGRLNMNNGVPNVYFPDEPGGLSPEEVTLAESLREQGYATGCFGKWHLGDQPEYMPLNQGFDYYYGIPYSNDMYIASHQSLAPDILLREGYTMEQVLADQKFCGENSVRKVKQKALGGVVPLMRNSEVIEYPCDQGTTTRRYVDEAIAFIERCGDKPFFTYITPSMPHAPLYASDQFRGKSKRGLYGDAVEEIDWNVGRLLKYLDESGLSENTLVIYASDNGPWEAKGEDGGSADPLRGGKFTMYDGGVKVPCIMRWSGTIPAGVVSDDLVASIDLFPTIMRLSGAEELSPDLDGVDQLSFLKDPSSGSLRDEYLYYRTGVVRGVRKGDWVYLPQAGESAAKKSRVELFNIREDVAQQKNLTTQHPDKIQELSRVMERYIK